VVDGKSQAKTKVKQKTLNPVWNEDIGVALNNAKSIGLTVYDKDLISADEVCGKIVLQMSDITSQETDVWLDLKPQGRLHVIYAFAPSWTDAQVASLTGLIELICCIDSWGY